MNAETIRGIAQRLLATEPDTPVRLRLLRDILRDEPISELHRTQADLKQHPTYDMLKRVRPVVSPKPPICEPISRLRPSLRKQSDVFRVAARIGLTQEDPHICKLIDATVSYHEKLSADRPWNDRRIRNVDRFFMLNTYMRGIPGALALISPDHPIVENASEKALAQVIAHYEANDYSLEFEDKIWPDIYRSELTDETISMQRNMGFCTTEYASIYTSEVYRLVGLRSAKLSEDVNQRYCNHMLRRLETIKGWVSTQDAIIAGILGDPESPITPASRPDVYASGIADHLIHIEDLRAYGCWRGLVEPFVAWLWEQPQEDGFWDFGAPFNGQGAADRFRLSRNWRSYRRYQDWTANVLLMMADYYTDSTARKFVY